MFPDKGSFYVRSFGRFTRQWNLWHTHLPNVKPYYAVKCNPDPFVLNWVYEAGGSFDCASAREMVLVKTQFGKRPIGNQVLFANPCKTNNDITYAKHIRVPWVTADSMEELVKMSDAKYKPSVLLRIAVEDSGSACPFTEKFGLYTDEVHKVACVAKQLQIPIIGISFHVGSGSNDPTAFRSAIKESSRVWSTLQQSALVSSFQVLDIGGGWSYDDSTFLQQANFTKRGLLETGTVPEQLIAEPGRFFAAPVQDLYVKVIGKKPKKDGGWRYTIDESIYGQFSCIPYDHAKPRIARVCLSETDKQTRRKSSATIFGRTCDSLDWIANSVYMEELEVGDWLYIPDMGAYTITTSTEFNGFPKPSIIDSDIRLAEPYLKWIDTLSFPLASMLKVPSS